MKKQKIIIFALVCLGLLAGSAAQALEVSYPSVGNTPAINDQSSLTDYLKYVYTFILSIIGIAAVGSLVYAGFLWMLSDSITSKEDSKKRIWGVVWGLVLALSAYLLLYTINPDFIKLKLPNMGAPSNPNSPGTPGTPGTPGSPGTPGNPPVPNPNQAEEDEIRKNLEAGEVEVYRDACPGTCTQAAPATCTQCVNLYGINPYTYDGILAMASGCNGCDISIQGGTEGGHQSGNNSHENGYKLDVAANPSLNNYILTESGSSVPEDTIGGYDTWYFAVPNGSAPDGKIYIRALKETTESGQVIWDLRFTDKPIEQIQKDKDYQI